MSHMAKNIETEPAWADSAGIRLHDGGPFLTISVDVLPGFIFIELVNKTSVPLLWVSCVIIPVKGDAQIRSKLVPLVIPPAGYTVIPIAYSSGETCECKFLVIFRRDVAGVAGSRLHVNQSRAYLIPTPESALFSIASWRALSARITRRELTLPEGLNLSPATLLAGLGSFINGKFVPISDLPKGDSSPSWACVDPVFMVTFTSPSNPTLIIHGFDTSLLDRIISEFPLWSRANLSRDADLYDLGVACTTLRDGLLLKTNTDYIRPAIKQVTRLVGVLGLRVPFLSQLLEVLASHGSLGDLSESERSLYERVLAEVETQVVGHPS